MAGIVILIFGAGTFAKVIESYLRSTYGGYLLGCYYVVDEGFTQRGYSIPFYLAAAEHDPSDAKFLIAVTQQNGHRDLIKQKHAQIREAGFSLDVYVHPTATIGSLVSYGEGCIISPYAIIEPYTSLGDCVIVRSGAYIGHHCTIEPYVYIAPRASMSGHVTVREGAFIGNNATVRDNVTIGRNAIVGAGAVVLRDVKDNECYRASEARLLSVDAREVKI